MARPGFFRHHKFLSLVYDLDGDDVRALGLCEYLWAAANENGDPAFPNARALELAAHWRGPKGQLVEFLLAAGGDGQPGLIEEDPDHPGGYLIHDYFDHAPDYVAKRAKREAARRARGLSLSDVRREAGRKGGINAANGGQLPANGRQTADSCRQMEATDQQIAVTPAPAPAPAPALKENPHPLALPDASPAAPIAETSSAQLSLLPGGKKLRVKRSPGTFDPSAYPFPDPRMDAHPTFRSVWGRWCADRAKRKKPLTEEACRLQLAKLATWGSVAAVASIERSLECGWVGLFPPPDDEPKVPKARPTRNEGGGGGMFVGGVGLTPTPQGQGGDDFDLTGGPA